MSFQDLLKAWRGEDLLSQALDDFVEMIENARWMYGRAATALWEETDADEYKRSIRERDLLVNKAERRIRKKVIRHLAINPRLGANQSLVLMSVVKDAERLGDYAKNLIEIQEYHTTYRDQNDLIPVFKEIQASIEWMFKKAGHAFYEGDEAEAHEIIAKMAKVTKDCEDLIDTILTTGGLSVPQAVAYALTARYFKRFAAHLGNIATSLVMPTHKLDYFDEDELGRK